MAKKKNLEWQNCSEAELRAHLSKWVGEWGGAGPAAAGLGNTIIFLNGEMGSGKSTFARLLLEILAPGQVSKGSPTFPLVQEYRGVQESSVAGSSRAASSTSGGGSEFKIYPIKIYHIDLYRLKSESELEESGILSQIEESGTLAMVEWAKQFPEAFTYWTEPQARARAKRVVQIEISAGATPDRRNFRIAGDECE